MKTVQLDVSQLRQTFTQGLADALESVRVDIRDQWPTEITPKNYSEGLTLASGTFGHVIACRARPLDGSGSQLETRSCAIKFVDIDARFTQCVQSDPDVRKVSNKLNKLTRRVITEAYILNRVRHSNIMHAHATIFDAETLTMQLVIPRLYPLEFFVEKYRHDKNGEPMHIRLIMMIVRQVCRGLEYLHLANIVHSDIHPNNIYMTRGGTIKLGHFAQCRMLTSEKVHEKCITPTGAEEFMCYEKQHNLFLAQSFSDCLPYDMAADIWSVGVLILHLVSYFPNEKWHRLPKNFALQMGEMKMPFKWMANELMQLRVRLTRAGDDQLKKFLGDKLLNIFPDVRATAAEILQSDLVKKWCNVELIKDKEFLVKSFVHRYDWPNRCDLEADGPNYDALETKDVPVEFYWDNTWKKFEKCLFAFKAEIHDGEIVRPGGDIERRFTHADTSLFELLMSGVDADEMNILDVIPIDQNIRSICFSLMKTKEMKYRTIKKPPTKDVIVKLPSTLTCGCRFARLTVYHVMEKVPSST